MKQYYEFTQKLASKEQFTEQNLKSAYTELMLACHEHTKDSKHRKDILNQAFNYVKQQNIRYRRRLSLPPIEVSITRNPLNIDKDWINQGSSIRQFITDMLIRWQSIEYQSSELTAKVYSDRTIHNEDVIAFVAISFMVFSGINHQSMIDAFFEKLSSVNLKTVNIGESFIHSSYLINLTYDGKGYGNEKKVSKDDDTLDELAKIKENILKIRLLQSKTTVLNTQQIVLDNITRCWLLLIKKHNIPVHQYDWKTCVKNYLKKTPVVIKHAGLAFLVETRTIKFSDFVKYARYVTVRLPNVYISQQLTNTLNNTIACCGLTVADFEQFKNTQIINSLKPAHDIKIQTTAKASLPSVSQQLRDAIKPKRFIKTDIYQDIYNAFVERSATKTKKNLTKLLNPSFPDSVNWLLHWLLSFFDDDCDYLNYNKKKTSLSVSSVQSYFTSIGKAWFYYTEAEDIARFDEDDFSNLYEDIISSFVDDSIPYRCARLFNLHGFMQDNFGVVDAHIPFFQSHVLVKAKLVSPKLYEGLLALIESRYTGYKKRVLTLVFILAYRTGMRKSEILGLTYADFEGFGLVETACIVRSNVYSRAKTTSSIRRILLHACLKPHELNLLNDFIFINESDYRYQPIFKDEYTDKPFPKNDINVLLSNLLDELLGCDTHGITMHSFRHTALTNFSLYLNGHQDLIDAFTDFTVQEVSKLKKSLFHRDAIEQKGWFGVASLAGHLHPNMTFLHYNHVALLMATYQCTQSELILPVQTISNISGHEISAERIYGDKTINLTNNDSDFLRTAEKGVPVKQLSKLLSRVQFGERKPVVLDNKQLSTSFIVLTRNTHKLNVDKLFKGYGIAGLFNFLSDLETNDFDSVLARHAISRKDAIQLMHNAQSIQNIKNSHNNYRFFINQRNSNKKTGITLSPGLLPVAIFHNEKKMLQDFFEIISDNLHNNENKLLSVLATLQWKINKSPNSIVFSAKNTKLDIFYQFLSDYTALFPIENIMIQVPTDQLRDAIHRQYKNTGMTVTTNHKKHIRFGIKHPDFSYVPKHKNNRVFSATLRYVVHVLLIVYKHEVDQFTS